MITVFTATFNRGYIIEKLYESLKSQTNINFEWLVIDDGSTDNTEILFKNICEEDNGFQIRYYKQKNGGKHRAINYGVKLAKGDLFFIVDSDDWLPSDSIENIYFFVKTIKGNECFVGVSGLKAFANGRSVGTSFVGDYIDSTSIQRNDLNIIGDKSEVFYTEILKKYPFPEIENEKFITESVVWNRIAKDGYKIRWFNTMTYYCEYIEDGITKQNREIFINNPKGYILFTKEEIDIYKLTGNSKYNKAFYCYEDLKIKFSVNELSKGLGVNRNILLAKIIYMKFKLLAYKLLKKSK